MARRFLFFSLGFASESYVRIRAVTRETARATR